MTGTARSGRPHVRGSRSPLWTRGAVPLRWRVSRVRESRMSARLQAPRLSRSSSGRFVRRPGPRGGRTGAGSPEPGPGHERVVDPPRLPAHRHRVRVRQRAPDQHRGQRTAAVPGRGGGAITSPRVRSARRSASPSPAARSRVRAMPTSPPRPVRAGCSCRPVDSSSSSSSSSRPAPLGRGLPDRAGATLATGRLPWRRRRWCPRRGARSQRLARRVDETAACGLHGGRQRGHRADRGRRGDQGHQDQR